MMVTFVSQCEKKALKRTRRVLDSFADRIGDNTWQTIITGEGLDAVKKLLRKTASKSTAVSCHWIRSRSRTELMWVVGNRDRFNAQGIVPVHYTQTNVFIGEYEVDLKKIYANTNGQRLDQHLFAVGFVASQILGRLVHDDKNLIKSAYLAGIWHDIGKIDQSFQSWLQQKMKTKSIKIEDDGVHIDKGTFSWEKYPRHNEISLLFYHLFFPKKGPNDESYERIKHAIYWHHAKPLRKQDFTNLIHTFEKLTDFEKEYAIYTSTINALQSSIVEISNNYLDSDEKMLELEFPKIDTVENRLDGTGLPIYKQYVSRDSIDSYDRYITKNAKNDVVRSALITADRLVSSLSGEALNEAITDQTLDELVETAFHKERGLNIAIDECLIGFEKRYGDSDRNKQQAIAAQKLADNEIEIGILKGPAGCGKTKIALEWCKKTNVKKLYWVCPRVQICEGIFNDLTSNEYLPNSRIEIITGEIKQTKQNNNIVDTDEKELFSGDVVITTIDQIVNSIITHKNVTTLIDLMDAHVVFDEYHEYITMPAFNLLFAELVAIKKLQQNKEKFSNTLLVSATPHPLYVQELLQLHSGDIIGIDSFNQSRYHIDFQLYDEKNEDDTNPLFNPQPENSIVISNTATTAQKSFVHNQARENGLLFHSKFLRSDKIDLFDKVFKTFKQKGKQEYDVLRSGPIVQASLNITCSNMVSEMTTAENFLQRLGRLDRFGECSDINQLTIAYTQDVADGKSRGSGSRFLSNLNSLQSTKVWYDFLRNNLTEEVNINKMYALYEQFYRDETCLERLRQELMSSLKGSVVLLENKIVDPVAFPNKSAKDESSVVKIKKNSLRGDSRFVQMARCRVETRESYAIESEYAYLGHVLEDAMTYEIDTIKGYDQSDKDLLAFMAKKHHNIKGGKKAYKDGQLLNEARDPNSPIYLSYTLEDLKKVEANPHPYAIYYMIGTRQPIGAMSLNQLTKENNEN
ncbi:CRISPR-associated endonuclease Cas3'' [Sulfuricurvum sp.]|uniref:CRISPR-associated endonuclease Cas3'' n=1 Tax=Sulfuricurvum sp. TaxID=2025608 RepID=UPI002620F63E|nr:CRISPR-associated endonuclease Cas3'' [Sulfuricurvum sp.]MDD3596510.1 CRISPR-associated endonuclease Cas3'' [Sulfuricurvum sp.]